MKTTIAVSALTLIANLAVANEYQEGNFASPDLTPDYSNFTGGQVRPLVDSDVRVSLQDYYAGNPEVFYGHEPTDRIRAARVSGPNALDAWYAGNPDVTGGHVQDGWQLSKQGESLARTDKPCDDGV